MDPASTQRAKLAQWAREMEFVLPDGTIPPESFFASATCTPNRRLLWEQVIKRIGDRRFVRKVRHEQVMAATDRVISREERRNKLQEKMTKISNQVEKVESDIAHRYSQVENQGKCIREMESAIEVLRKKIILFESLKRRQSRMLAYYKNLNDELKLLNRPLEFPATSNSDSKEWLQTLEHETGHRWFDPGLKDDIKSRIVLAGPWLSCSLLGTVLTESLNEFKEAYATSEELIAQNEKSFRCSAPPIGKHWALRIAKEKLTCRVIDDLLHWCKGQELANEAMKREKNEDITLPREIPLALKVCHSMDTEVNNQINDNIADIDMQLQTISEKLSVKTKRYQLLKKEIVDLRKCLEVTNDDMIGCQRKIFDATAALRVNISDSVRNGRDLLQIHSSLLKKHSSLLWHAPHKTFKEDLPEKLMTPLKLQNKLRCFEDENLRFWSEICDKVFAQEVAIRSKKCILPLDLEVEKESLLPTSKEWERHVDRTLTRAMEKGSLILTEVERGQRVASLMRNQTFGDMIPESVTFHGLSFKEWQIQYRLMRTVGEQFRGFDREMC